MKKILICGLPGAGKTYLARELHKHLKYSAVIDGDDVRKMYGNDLGFSPEDRVIQIAAGGIRFQDLTNKNNWQEIIDKIIAEHAHKHPMLIAKELAENLEISRLSFVMAGGHAQAAFYLEDNENAVDLSAVRDMGEHRHHANCNHKTH